MPLKIHTDIDTHAYASLHLTMCTQGQKYLEWHKNYEFLNNIFLIQMKMRTGVIKTLGNSYFK